MLREVLAGVALAIAGVAQAAPAPVWTVDRAASKLRFQASASGERFQGEFGRWVADIRFDPKNLAGSAVIVRIDMASARTGNAERDGMLPTDEWFDTRKYAQASFAARSFKDLGGGRYQAIGTLTMRGTAKPFVLPFTLAIQGNTSRMTSTATIDRRVFGVGQGQFAGADTVPFAVQVGIQLTARRP